jgi:hypothetical protein
VWVVVRVRIVFDFLPDGAKNGSVNGHGAQRKVLVNCEFQRGCLHHLT